MTSRDDLALLQQTMPTGTEGVKALEKFIREGNNEVRKLLFDECDVLLECRYCRNIFRSVINFISHKRAFCRASHLAVVMANQGIGGDEDGKQETATKKRVGQLSSLSRRLETTMVPIGDTPEMLALYTLPRVMKELPTTTFADGLQKVIGSLPANLARKESIPEDRVCLTMPQDNSSRYKEMSLRSRKAQNSDKPQHREFTSNDIKIIENFEKQDVRCADFVLLQCDHPTCSHFRPFHSLQALAYHCSLRHTKPFLSEGGDERWPCLLCCRHMWSLEGVNTHMMRVHPNVKEDHLRKRAEEDKAASKGKKGAHHAAAARDHRRFRSLSIDYDAQKDSSESEEEEEEDQEEEMIIEEEETGRGRRRGGAPARGASVTARRGRSAGEPSGAGPLRLQARLDRQSRGQSGTNSDDYGEPPVLLPVGDCGLEEEAEEEDEDEAPIKKPKSKKKKSLTPEESSERDGEEENEIKKEDEEEDDEEENSKPLTEAQLAALREAVNGDKGGEERGKMKKEEGKRDSVAACVEDMVETVCDLLGDGTEPTEEEQEDNWAEETVIEEKQKSSSVSPPSRGNSSSKRRGRPKKSEAEDRKNESPNKPGRPAKRISGTTEEVKPKRQYIRKKDRERMEEEEKEKRGERETASSENSDTLQPSSSSKPTASASAADADAARPHRHRKRPRWMMNGEEVLEEGSNGGKKKEAEGTLDNSIVDDSEEEMETPKETIKKKKEKSYKMVTPGKKKGDKSDSQNDGPIGEEIRTEPPEVLLFTPKSGKAVLDRMNNATPDPSRSSSKRKQNLGKLVDETEDIMIVSVSDPQNGPKRSDLTSVPVYLSEHQQQIFFAGLIHHKNNETGKRDHFECTYCKVNLPNIRDGRRHMVAHLRVMRLRCGLCGAGSFFCIDMRNHLQLRGCPKLHEAPASYVRPGTPCMTKEHADELTFVAHSASPGRALFTSGKIVSIMDNRPYLPDPVIEEKILGPTRVPPRNSSPRKPAHKFSMATVLKETDKGTVSLAAAQRPTAAAAAAILPIEDAAVHYYEDAETEPPQAPPTQAPPPLSPAPVAAAAELPRRASMPPPEAKAVTATPAVARAASVAATTPQAAAAASTETSTPAPARRALTFNASPSTSPESANHPLNQQRYVDISQIGHRAMYNSSHGGGSSSNRQMPSIGARTADSSSEYSA
ncbi:hypothetical protein PMAYCL1PPCAC_00675 [Pristionchus mayeri]|uniref:C2H2-type domain-containing protein n=1 Tax=Pristionchus mayeri TaxID=1317129 RepID=A0AAN4Z4E0_9BILA|nr:hypothetical protein PMAYCL1PPCAC_00675 [Pristionchus mayeri]